MKEELGNSRMVGCWGSSTCTSQNSLASSLSVLHELSKKKKKKKGIKRQGEKKKKAKKAKCQYKTSSPKSENAVLKSPQEASRQGAVVES